MSDHAFSLDGQVVLVTGASRGIGDAIATAAGEAGADVAGSAAFLEKRAAGFENQ